MMTETVVTVQPNQPPNNNATKPSDQQALSWLKINLDYFKTLPGQLKLIELIFGIICMALASPAYLSGTHWFLFVVTISFIGTLIWVFVYLLSIREALSLPIDWVLSELVNTGICTILYCVAFIVQLCVWSPGYVHFRAVNLAAGCFGLFNTLVYGFATYLLHKEWKSTIFGIICMALASPAYLSGTHWFLFVVTISFIGTLIWVFVYLLSIREALSLPIDWVLSELVNTGICTILYCVAFLVQLGVWSPGYVDFRGRAVNLAAGCFGLFNTLVYGFATYLLHKEWKSTVTN